MTGPLTATGLVEVSVRPGSQRRGTRAADVGGAANPRSGEVMPMKRGTNLRKWSHAMRLDHGPFVSGPPEMQGIGRQMEE
jgi:hypothetical protein